MINSTQHSTIEHAISLDKIKLYDSLNTPLGLSQ